MVYRECTRHNWCSLRKFSKVGEVKSALPDLNGLPLALVLIISARNLPLRLSRLGAHLGKVIWTPASEIAVIVVRASGLLNIRPKAGTAAEVQIELAEEARIESAAAVEE